jgi:CRP-like cAMP-binding protein
MVETKSVIEFDWRKSTLFQFCNEADWDIFQPAVSLTEKPAGSVIWSEGERSIRLVCIVSGILESVKKTPEWGKPIIMARFLPGASVGELIFAAVVGEEHSEHSTSLQVAENASLLILDEVEASLLQEKAPDTVAKLLRGAASLQLKRLRQLNRRLATLF